MNYPPPSIDPSLYFDRREHASMATVYKRRPWSRVTGICLHQTACNMGERPGRYDTLGAHVAVTRAGKVVLVHSFTDVVAHANGWNAQTVGIEMDGLYAGIEGDSHTVWDNPETAVHEQGMRVTPELVESTRAVIRWICQVVAANGGQVKVLVAHRQSSDTRRNDPGSALWQDVAMPMHAELGLGDGGPGFKIGDGYAIPEEWNPIRKGIKY